MLKYTLGVKDVLIIGGGPKLWTLTLTCVYTFLLAQKEQQARKQTNKHNNKQTLTKQNTTSSNFTFGF